MEKEIKRAKKQSKQEKEKIKKTKEKIKIKIKELKEQKQYDDIYDQYGREVFLKSVPRKTKKENIKRLKKEGKYFDIYEKYGEKEYKKILIKAQYEDRKKEKGTVRAWFWKLKTKTLNNIATIGTGVILGVSTGLPAIAAITQPKEVKKIEIEKAQDIKEYNQKIKKYAEEINKLKLTDTEIFMKVMNDMWKSIKGYGEPSNDIVGYLQLALKDEEGVGVCRHMASDVAEKLNAINPKYNAKMIVVNMSEDGEYNMANIERHIVANENNEKQEKNEEQENTDIIIGALGKVLEFAVGNHAVVLLEVPEDNIMLVLDPTNPGIGVYKNGKITMLNSPKENGMKLKQNIYGESINITRGIEDYKEVINNLAKSYEKANLTEEQIEEKYGVKAQNRALDKVTEEMNEKNKFIKEIQVTIDGEKVFSSEQKEDANERY